MSNVNRVIGYLIAGRISRAELEAYLVNQGFTPTIVDVHLRRADAQMEKGRSHAGANGIKPIERRELYEDQQTVTCDECGIVVPLKFGEFSYNAELDMSCFTCDRCLEEAEDL